jgi:ABC-2 type transport system permease protein
MKMLAFSGRNAKEITRDPLTVIFGVGLPAILLVLINILNRSIPAGANSAFELVNFAPGMAVFSLAFISLFSALLISGDRGGAFLSRIFASPLTAKDYMLGYALPLIPIGLLQGIVCFIVAVILGLDISGGILAALVALIPVCAMYIGFGLLFGCALSDKQVGGIFTIFVNLTTWLSGTWFPLDLIGGTFKTVCNLLPFSHSVDAVRAALSCQWGDILPHLAWVVGYAAAAFIAASLVFKRKMRG